MNRLERPLQGRVIAGVCAALAARFGIGVTAMRVITVLLVVLAGLSLWVYIIMWIVIPSQKTPQQA